MALHTHPRYRLVIAANRDEFYERPTAPACFWKEEPGLLAGQDLKAGGTWLGINRFGKIAAITNYRQPVQQENQAPSRGKLVKGFLTCREDAGTYLRMLTKNGDKYNGFNLMFGDKNRFCWYSNQGGENPDLASGMYGLSNQLLDTPWPKVIRIKKAMKYLLSEQDELIPEDIFKILCDSHVVDDPGLPDTGISIERERVLSPIFIASPGYGTRSSTIIFIDREDQVTFLERTYNSDPSPPTTVKYEFRIEP